MRGGARPLAPFMAVVTVLTALTALTALAPPAAAQDKPDVGGLAEAPTLTVTPGPPHAITGPAHVGEHLTLRIAISSPHPFLALRWAPPEIPGAAVHTLVKPRTRRYEAFGGGGWRLETVVAVIPARSGVLTIPPVRATGKTEPPGAAPLAFDLTSGAIHIPIRPAETEGWWLPAARIVAEETWSRPPETLRAGDTVRRSVTFTAEGAPADRLPRVEMTATRGARVMGLRETRRTDITPTGLIGVLRRDWDILVETEEVITLSAVAMPYWDTDADRPATALAPDRRVEPLPPDVDALKRRILQEESRRAAAWGGAGLALMLVPLAMILAAIVWLGLAWRLRPEDRALRRALMRAESDMAREAAVLNWADGAKTLTALAAQRPSAAPALRALSDRIYGPATPETPPPALAAPLIAATRRARLRRIRARLSAGVTAILGPVRRLP